MVRRGMAVLLAAGLLAATCAVLTQSVGALPAGATSTSHHAVQLTANSKKKPKKHHKKPAPVSRAGSGSASITLTGPVMGQLTHVTCPDPSTADITGTINGTNYELQLTAPTSGARYALLFPGSSVVNGWYAPKLSSSDTINAAGGAMNDYLPPNPNGSASGTVHATGRWSC